MDWRDEGILLAVRAHGESSAIIETLTRDHGRHAGLVRGARGAKLAPAMQPGTQLALEWRARLAEHLGHFRIEPVRSRAAAIMADRAALARQCGYDPDLWVIEVEDPRGRHMLDDPGFEE